MKLGNVFPQEDTQEYVERQMTPGQVLYLFCDFTKPPKEKYLVFVCREPEPLLFVVNSSVPPFIANRPDLRKCQVELHACEYGFLKHDSYVNCAEIIQIGEDAILEQVLAQTGRIRGTLSEATKKEIVAVVHEAITISPAHKQAVELALTGHEDDEEGQ